MTCPKCHEEFLLPLYSCPECSVLHTKLVPGKDGMFKRKCKCGQLPPILFLDVKISEKADQSIRLNSLLSQEKQKNFHRQLIISFTDFK